MKRLEYIDIAKGLTICLMVIGHSSIPHTLSNWIWSFHMPFFFFMSGLFTSWDKDYYNFVRGKTISLLVPFLVYSIVNLLLYPLMGGEEDWSEHVKSILIKGWGGIALWFVPVLYLSLIICRLVHDKFLMIFIILFSLSACILNYHHIKLPWTLSTVSIASAYILMARRFKEQTMKAINGLKGKSVFIAITGCLLITICVSHYFKLDLSANQVLPFFPLLIGAVAGTFFMLLFSKEIVRLKIISKTFSTIGKYTFEVMAFSQCIIVILNIYIRPYIILKYLIMAVVMAIIIVIKQKIKSYFRRTTT